MIGDVLVEIVAQVVGETITVWLFPRRRKPTPIEGIWNASLGSVAAFLGSLAALFVATPLVAIAQDRRDEDVVLLVMLAMAVPLGQVGNRLAQRAFHVTSRRHRLATFGLWCSRTSVVLSVLTALFLAVRLVSAGVP